MLSNIENIAGEVVFLKESFVVDPRRELSHVDVVRLCPAFFCLYLLYRPTAIDESPHTSDQKTTIDCITTVTTCLQRVSWYSRPVALRASDSPLKVANLGAPACYSCRANNCSPTLYRDVVHRRRHVGIHNAHGQLPSSPRCHSSSSSWNFTLCP